uniref:RraA family protein n=1 Tax=Marinobacterium profundum TaxID=1714300 RepID=UPI0008316CEF|nr:methyltransferase [Marinobacterium profundum]
MSNSNNNTSDVIKEIERVSPGVVSEAFQYQAAILADVNGRRGAMNGRIQGLSPKMKMAGPAFTVEVRPGDNLMIHAALALAKPGDVLVIDGKGDLSAALMGTIMMTQAETLGLAGVIVDGAVRDAEEIREMGYPVFAAGTNPNGPTKLVPGRVNWPVSVGGVTVRPGDLVVADFDGVVVIEKEKAEGLLPLAAKKHADETARIEGIKSGKQLRPSWLEKTLVAAGVLKEGEVL